MKLKDVLIGLVLIQMAVHIYYLKNIISYIWTTLTDMGFYDIFRVFSISGQVIGIGFLIVGIIGVVNYFTTQDIYNRALKAFLIHHTVTLCFYLPQRLAFMLTNFEGSETLWMEHLLFFVAIITAIIGVLVYSNQPIRVLPQAISRNTVRLLHYFIDRVYIFINLLGATSLFLTRGSGFFGIGGDETRAIGFLILAFMPLVYYFICEAGFNQTLGKVATGAYVRSESGNKASILNLMGRTLCRMIPFEAFSFLTDPMAKWHDKFSGTDVFYASKVNFNEEDTIIDHLITNDEVGN